MASEASKLHIAPAGARATNLPHEPTIEDFAASLREMLDCYWGAGDGQEPPAFIAKAKSHLSAYDYWEVFRATCKAQIASSKAEAR
jgi:hypothetical protein